MKEKMIFKPPPPKVYGINGRVIRLSRSCVEKLEKVMFNARISRASDVIEQLLDYIGDNYEVRK